MFGVCQGNETATPRLYRGVAVFIRLIQDYYKVLITVPYTVRIECAVNENTFSIYWVRDISKHS